MSCHKTLYEALQQIRLDEFLDSLDEKSEEKVNSLKGYARQAYLDGCLQDFVETKEFMQLVTSYEEYVQESSAKSKTFAYWSMYIKMIG